MDADSARSYPSSGDVADRTGSYETAWTWLHKLRAGWWAGAGALGPFVQMDEALVGEKAPAQGAGAGGGGGRRPRAPRPRRDQR